MSEKDENKKSAMGDFKNALLDNSKLKENIASGLKSTNSKVRALATKLALKTQEYEFIKKNVLPLMKSDKSKKVLRSISKVITRKELIQKLSTMVTQKSEVKKTEAPEAPKAE